MSLTPLFWKVTLTPLLVSACLALGFSGSAFAYVDTPVFTPQPVQPGQDVSMTLRYGDCDLFTEDPTDPTMYPRLTRIGSSIRYELFGFNYQGVPLACIVPDSTRIYNLGSFPAGTYTFELVMASPYPGGVEYQTISSTPIVVGNGVAGPVSLPIDNAAALAALIFALGLFAVAGLRAATGART